MGLSPYTRGNLERFGFARERPGSIPVHTGKPRVICATTGFCWVYPRTHGETLLVLRLLRSIRGLSPYTRGNPCSGLWTRDKAGSIPVHTGKPLLWALDQSQRGVYPRTHGETFKYSYFFLRDRGLSPYTRGNPMGLFHR